jgi:phosphate transport system protein
LTEGDKAMRRNFDEQLEKLNGALIGMGEMVERSIANVSKALIEQDTELAKHIIASDDDIDHMEKDIESQCLRLIMQQQPVASDLRHVSSILKIITDLERIADHASDISEIILLLAGKQYIKKLEHIPRMAEETIKMVTQSISSYVNKDIGLANEIIARDDIIDNLFVVVKNELIELIKINSNNGDQAIDLVMIAKYFERIGDHAENIAEWAIFSISGWHKDIKVM